jgi:hypothetical protein
MDEEDQIDTRLYEHADERMTSQRAMEMQIKRSINDERRHRERIQNCRQCMVRGVMSAICLRKVPWLTLQFIAAWCGWWPGE